VVTISIAVSTIGIEIEASSRLLASRLKASSPTPIKTPATASFATAAGDGRAAALPEHRQRDRHQAASESTSEPSAPP
jgi:hypothetical protein